MTNLGGVNVNRPQRQSRLAIQSGQQVPTDFRYPGEPEEGRSKQAQSWVDAGQDLMQLINASPLVAGVQGFGARLNSLRDYAAANPPSTEDIIAGTGTRARLDPLNIGGAIGLPEIGSGKPRSIVSNAPSDILGNVDLSGYNLGTSPERGAVEEAPGRTIDELIALAAQYAPQGPDYGAVRQQLMADTEALNAQLQAMYAAAAERAGENVSRLGDIYGGAQAGIGAAYDTGTGNVEQAYASAQQQAADQLARLGIEAAAPNIINPMALSQAESVAGLEAGRSAGLSAANRYGATAQDFGSQMAQVLQQEGLGQNQALLAALQGRLGNLAMREAEARAQYNPIESALQYLQLEQAINPQADPRDAQQEAEFLYQQEQDDTNVFRQYYQDYYSQTYDQAEARELARADAIAGIMGPRIQQRAMTDPNFVPMASQ